MCNMILLLFFYSVNICNMTLSLFVERNMFLQEFDRSTSQVRVNFNFSIFLLLVFFCLLALIAVSK